MFCLSIVECDLHFYLKIVKRNVAHLKWFPYFVTRELYRVINGNVLCLYLEPIRICIILVQRETWCFLQLY